MSPVSQAIPRKYDASNRREQAQATRRRVLEAAATTFVERGWSGTSMRDVARAAGVSVETVYGSVGSKSELLRASMDIAVVGDDEPSPLSERPQWRAMAEGATSLARAEAVAELLAALHARTAPLFLALSHAAVGEPDLAAMLHRDQLDIREQNRQGVRAVAHREPTELELDLVAAVTGNETFLMLTERQGYSDADYRTFVVAALTRLLGLEDEPTQ
ncbi:MAG: TetR family transcriptional regulator [Nocardioidaceae bacterium]|nr:TetR family transcriptional regulator [Nocardioidaceae bacterium]